MRAGNIDGDIIDGDIIDGDNIDAAPT